MYVYRTPVSSDAESVLFVGLCKSLFVADYVLVARWPLLISLFSWCCYCLCMHTQYRHHVRIHFIVLRLFGTSEIYHIMCRIYYTYVHCIIILESGLIDSSLIDAHNFVSTLLPPLVSRGCFPLVPMAGAPDGPTITSQLYLINNNTRNETLRLARSLNSGPFSIGPVWAVSVPASCFVVI